MMYRPDYLTQIEKRISDAPLEQVFITSDFLDIADEDISSRGRPLCKPTLISSLSGYIMCEDADPQIAATDSELREIVSYLNSGFYYE